MNHLISAAVVKPLKAIVLICLLLTGLPTYALDARLLPIAPTLPTADDCRQLDHDFYELKTVNFRNMDICMKVLSFGYENAPACGNSHSISAFENCEGIRNEQCELDQAQSRAGNLCRERVRQIDVANQHTKASRDDQVRNLLKLEKQGEKIVSSFQTSAELVRDPEKFLKKALSNKIHSAALNMILPNGRLSGNQEQNKLAEEVYKYASNQANRGISATPNSVVRAIQKSSLDQINAEYRHIFGQLDSALRDMDNFSNKLASTRLGSPETPASVPIIQNNAPAKGENRECALLDDFNASSRLAANDPDRFNALMRNCTK